MVDFKGTQFPKTVILHAVFFYVRYLVSYRDLQEIFAELVIAVDYATLNRWVIRYSPQIAAQARLRKRPTARSWRVDETYIKVKGKWTYLYRAVDRDSQAIDFMLSERRDQPAAQRFFRKAIATNGLPGKVVIDKSGANLAGLEAINTILKFKEKGDIIEIRQIKYLNNILEQDHRFIKRFTKSMTGFKAFHSASATILVIEVAHMIRKNQFANDNRSSFRLFAQLAA